MRIINGRQSGLLSDKEFADMLKEFPIEQRKKFLNKIDKIEFPKSPVEIYKTKTERELERALYFSRCIVVLKRNVPFFKKYKQILRNKIWNYFFNRKFWRKLFWNR